MNPVQLFRIISVVAALSVGFWLPIQLIDFQLSNAFNIALDLGISLVSIMNLWLHFEKNEKSWRVAKNWLNLGVLLDIICFIPITLIEYFVFE